MMWMRTKEGIPWVSGPRILTMGMGRFPALKTNLLIPAGD
jgi:hypothetical protein